MEGIRRIEFIIFYRDYWSKDFFFDYRYYGIEMCVQVLVVGCQVWKDLLVKRVNIQNIR